MYYLLSSNKIKFIVLIFLAISLHKCGNDYPAYKIKITSPNHVPGNFTVDSLRSINFFLEDSKSMRGFINKANEDDSGYVFYKHIRYLITDCEAKFPQTNIYTISNRITNYNGKRELFLNKLNNNTLMQGSSTPINQIFKKIIASTGKKDLSIFASDCVFDIGNNIGEKNNISTDIYESLNQDYQLSATVFQFYSEFDGDWYYDRRGHATPFRGAGVVLHNRPFYIWIFGHPDLMRVFLDSQILSGFVSNYAYGISYPSEASFQVLKGTTYGKLAVQDGGKAFTLIDVTKENPGSFILAMDLSDYPTYIRDIKYLRNNLIFSEDYLNSDDMVQKNVYDSETIKTIDNYNRIAPVLDRNNFTHFIKFTFKSREIHQYTDFNLVLKDDEPQWIQQSHLKDDYGLRPKEMEGLTYGLKHIISGFTKRYNKQKQPIFNIEFQNVN